VRARETGGRATSKRARACIRLAIRPSTREEARGGRFFVRAEAPAGSAPEKLLRSIRLDQRIRSQRGLSVFSVVRAVPMSRYMRRDFCNHFHAITVTRVHKLDDTFDRFQDSEIDKEYD